MNRIIEIDVTLALSTTQGDLVFILGDEIDVKRITFSELIDELENDMKEATYTGSEKDAVRRKIIRSLAAAQMKLQELNEGSPTFPDPNDPEDVRMQATIEATEYNDDDVIGNLS